MTVENEITGERFVVSDWRVNAFLWANGYGRGGERVRVVYTSEVQEGWCLRGQVEDLNNPSCDLPKEVDGAGEHKQSDLEFKPFGSNSMNGFW